VVPLLITGLLSWIWTKSRNTPVTAVTRRLAAPPKYLNTVPGITGLVNIVPAS
jgi:hypothetical protein